MLKRRQFCLEELEHRIPPPPPDGVLMCNLVRATYRDLQYNFRTSTFLHAAAMEVKIRTFTLHYTTVTVNVFFKFTEISLQTSDLMIHKGCKQFHWWPVNSLFSFLSRIMKLNLCTDLKSLFTVLHYRTHILRCIYLLFQAIFCQVFFKSCYTITKPVENSTGNCYFCWTWA
jgi:hypothetical protein